MAFRLTTRLRCQFDSTPTKIQRTGLQGSQGTWEHDEKVVWRGPPTHSSEVPSVGYLGNIRTPNWMLGSTDEEGDEIFHKAKSIFQPFSPSVKKAVGNFRLRLVPGQASAGPPVGPTFSGMGVKSMDFIKEFNAKTDGVFERDPDLKLKVYLRFYEDKTYQYRILPPPTGYLIAKASGLPPAGKKKRGIKGWNDTALEGYAGYITLQQLYHIAALANSWGHHPDWAPLEMRVTGMINSAKIQGLCVLGVHSDTPPVLGFTDKQYRDHINVKADEWDKTRYAELQLNPLDRLPWHTRMRFKNTEGYVFKDSTEKKVLFFFILFFYSDVVLSFI